MREASVYLISQTNVNIFIKKIKEQIMVFNQKLTTIVKPV